MFESLGAMVMAISLGCGVRRLRPIDVASIARYFV